MAREAKVIVSIVPNGMKFEDWIDRMQQRLSQMSQVNVTGGSGGGSGSRGASSGGSQLAETRAQLAADMELAKAQKNLTEQGRVRTEQIKLGRDATTQAYVQQRMQMATTARVAEQTSRTTATAQRQAAQSHIRFLNEEARLLDKVGRLERQREAAQIRYANSPQQLQTITQLYDQRIAEARAATQASARNAGGTHYTGGFMTGFAGGGGFGQTLGTIARYGLVYKAIDIPLRALNSTIDVTKDMLIGSTRAFADYEEQAAKTARTMRQPGFTTMGLKNIVGADALDFITRYRVTMEDASKAIYELGSANFTAEQALQTYQVPLKVAIGLQSDITQTTQFMTQALKIHGDQMGKNLTDYEKMVRIGAVLAKTWEIEQVEVADMTAGYKYVAGTATALKIPLEQLIPILGYLSTYGQKGSVGGVGLNQFFTEISRNIQITSGQIEGLKKSARGMEHVINLKPGKYTPFDLLVEVSKAGSKVKDMDDAGWARLSGGYNALFNNRATKPALLLSDENRLQQLMKNIAEVTGLTTKENEKLIDSFANLMQNTPNAQLQVMHNNLYVLGVKFMQAATGANSLTGTLITMNDWLRSMDGFVANVGVNLRVTYGAHEKAQDNRQTGNDWVEKVPLLDNVLDYVVEYNRAKKTESADAYKEQASRVAIEAYANALSEGKTNYWARYSAQMNVVRWATEERKKFVSFNKDYAKRPEWNTLAWLSAGMNPAYRSNYVTLQTPQEKWLDDVLGIYNKEQKNQKLANMFQQNWNPDSPYPNYQGTPTGKGGSGGSGSGLWDPGSIAGYDVSRAQKLSWDNASRGSHREAGVFDILLSEIKSKGDTVDVALRKLAMEGALGAYRPAKKGVWPAHIHGVFPDMATEEAARLAKQLGVSLPKWTQQFSRPVISSRDMLEDLAREQLTRMEDKYSLTQSMPDIAASLGFRYPSDWYQSDLKDMLTGKKWSRLPLSTKSQIAQSLASLTDQGRQFGYQKQALALDFRSRDQETLLKPYIDGRKELQKVTTALANEESVYGRSLNLTGRQYQNALDTLQSLNAQRAKAVSLQEEEQNRYNAAKGILDIMRNKPLDEMTPKEFEELERQSRQVDEFKSRLDGAISRVEELDGNILNLSTSTLPMLKKALSDIPLENFTRGIERRTDLNRILFESRGENYELSPQREKDIYAQIVAGRAKMADIHRRMMENPRAFGVLQQEWLDATTEEKKLWAILRGLPTQRNDAMREIRLRTYQTQAGWARGTDRQRIRAGINSSYMALDLEMEQMRKQYSYLPQDVLNQYEQTMRADIIAKPWLDARDRIEGEFSDMFTNVFSSVANGDNPFRAVDSIVKSMQGQMVQNWVRSNLGDFFDKLATKETGIAKPDFNASMAEWSSAVTMGTNSLTTFNSALDIITAKINGIGMGMGDGLPAVGMAGNVGVMAPMTSALTKAFDKSIQPLVDKYTRPLTSATARKSGIGNDLIAGLQNYSTGALFGGMIGGAFGYDPTSAGVAGGLGYAAGMALNFGPWGAAALGLASIFGFGKKKRRQQPQDPQRNMYGMPAYEHDAYMYNLYTRSNSFSAMSAIDRPINPTVNNVGPVTIQINGGDVKEVKRVVTEVLNGQFGTIAQIKARTGGY